MKSGAAVLSLSASLALAAGCAPVATLGGAPLERHVLAKAGPAKLAKALADDLRDPAFAPYWPPPEVLALRGPLEEVAARTAAGPFPRMGDAVVRAQDAPALSQALSAPSQIAAAASEDPQAEAPAPNAPREYAVALGRFGDVAQAAAIWRELAAADPLAVKGLAPRYAPDGAGGVTLLAGPLADAETAAGRCTAFAALGVTCAPAPFRGRSPAGAAS